MPLLTQLHITPEDLTANPQVLYLFGDNVARAGKGGQAFYGRGMANGIGVRTKRAPNNMPNAFWTDDTYEYNCAAIDDDLRRAWEAIRDGGIVVVPADGIGTGRAQLAAKAPRTLAYLQEQLAGLARLAAI